MKLKIGDTEFDVELVDYWKRGGHFVGVDLPYFVEPTKPLDVICEDFNKLPWRIVCEYDCVDHEGILKNVDQDGKIRIRPWFRLRGVNGKGKNTKKADERLLYRFGSDTGHSDIGVSLAELDTRLGSYTLDVPFNYFLKKFTPEKSFYIGLQVWWIMFNLKLPADYPGGVIVVAFPYRTQFAGNWTINCKTGQRRDIAGALDRDEQEHTLRIPPGDTGRAAARKRVDEEVALAKEAITRLKKRLAEYEAELEREPDSKRLKDGVKTFKRSVKNQKKKLNERLADRKALKEPE